MPYQNLILQVSLFFFCLQLLFNIQTQPPRYSSTELPPQGLIALCNAIKTKPELWLEKKRKKIARLEKQKMIEKRQTNVMINQKQMTLK